MTTLEATEQTLNSQTRVQASPDQIFADLAGEAAVLNLKSGIYYGLDALGARIWKLMQTPQTIGQIREALLAEYDVDADRCEKDLYRLIQRMREEDLVVIVHEGCA